MKEIILIRHAESSANIDTNSHSCLPDHEIPLSIEGIKQSDSLKLYDATNKKITIYSSPYKRAYDTAKLSLPYGSKILLEPLVCERKVKWNFDRKYYDELISNWKEKGSFWWKGFDHEYESGADVYQRACIFLNKISIKHFLKPIDETVYVYTHGFFMKMMQFSLNENVDNNFNNHFENPENTEQLVYRSVNGTEWELFKSIK